MAKMEDAFNDFYNEFKDWTKKQILHRTFDIILKDTEEIGEKDKEIERLNNIMSEVLEMVCCIEHNLEKYEEIGLDHLDYAENKVYELKDYLIEELKEGKQ